MCRPTLLLASTSKQLTANGKTITNSPSTVNVSSAANDTEKIEVASASDVKSLTKAISTSHTHERSTDYDLFLFLGPAMIFGKFTDVSPIYIVGIIRILVLHLALSLNYLFVDKDNYLMKLTKKQLHREKREYLTASYLHMWIQAVLQIVFPSMFFNDASIIGQCMFEALVMHLVVVEPLYYAVHRWLHKPEIMKSMHGFHHLSIKTTPTTAVVQNLTEHMIYIATFGPAFFIPFLIQGRQHWVAIGTYLVLFDIINMYGHTNIELRKFSWLFRSEYSPMLYLFYSPEFHQGHHSYFNANYALFMPMWDYMFGTARTYERKQQAMLPKSQQDFVFIGHNGGLGHLFTIPELCLYNVYDDYPTLSFIPIKFQFMIMHFIMCIARLFVSFYYCSRYCIANEFIGRIIVLARSPWDYMSPKSYQKINEEIIQLMVKEHKKHGTRYFGLGNLNKMKQLNDGGIEIERMVNEHPYLKNENIRVWTGDTMTVASVYHQVADIPNLTELYYIGAGGKVGTGVCEMLTKTHPHVKIRVFSRNIHFTNHSNISYSTDLSEIVNYRVVLVGKILSNEMYTKAFDKAMKCGAVIPSNIKTRFLLDYTVPALPLPLFKTHLQLKELNIQHVRVGLLRTKNVNNPFLKGQYDYCMSHDENHIVPCHFGCLLHTSEGRETNEVGDIDLMNVERLWKLTLARGFQNIDIDYATTI